MSEVAFVSRVSFVVTTEDGRDLRQEPGQGTCSAATWKRIEALLPVAVAAGDIEQVRILAPETLATEGAPVPSPATAEAATPEPPKPKPSKKR